MTTADALPASSLDLAQEAISSPRIGAGFASLGAAVPKRILTNAELAEMVETSDEWIRSRTGIEQRHVAGPDEFTSDLAVAASLDALRRSPFTAEQIDLVLCATTSGDYLWPATASLVQHRIGARRAAAFDVAAACSGFCCAVATAAAWIRSNDADTVLVVGADTLTKQLNWRDRATCVLFGDGAGAAVMTACSPDEGVLASVLGSDGAGVEQVWIPAGGTREPITPEGLVAGRNRIHMRGADVYQTETVMPLESIRAKYEAFGWHVLEIDGNNIEAVIEAVDMAKAITEEPVLIIADTIPGKGVDFMEYDFHWHGKPPNKQEAKKALHELRTLGGRIRGEHE